MSEHEVSRRQIIGGGLVLAAGMGVGPRRLEAAPAAFQVPRRVLGKTGEKIPILLQGGSLQLDPRFDPKLAEGFRYGVNYIDAADCYAGGSCEPAVAAFHERANVRSKIWITSKSDKHDIKGFEETFAQSLERLKTDYIDMYFLHMLRDPKYLNDDLKAVLDRLKKEKKVKYFGFSCHHENVADLLNVAAKTPWVDAVMFRYNFRQYGNEQLNRAMDAAHAAKVGMIAMKTQGSAVSFEEKWQKFQQTGKWNKYQAVLKAVWADERISAAVSAMDNLDKVRENVAAALDKTKLTLGETKELLRYAQATRHLACDGCDHLCNPAVNAPVQIGPTLRYLMYHDVYGQRENARALYQALPPEARAIAGVDFSGANAACPHGVDVATHMKRAAELLA
jgi:predicted aldo/keto reductase-like oxidoreductase